ncbi:MAG: NUDIX domain-containing protein, partial [Candidatus Woesearchaeota archaeon]|nr:NUDIX domain-containing protein [Candidatus Woesearchaeota archaeon]
MKLLATICFDKILDDAEQETYSKRNAVRAVLINEKKKIALLYLQKYNYHKLPGGGIEKAEKQEQALIREIKEETGCSAEIIAELGFIIELRTNIKQRQHSYCYLAKVLTKTSPEFTIEEKEAGMKLKWVLIDEAIRL